MLSQIGLWTANLTLSWLFCTLGSFCWFLLVMLFCLVGASPFWYHSRGLISHCTGGVLPPFPPTSSHVWTLPLHGLHPTVPCCCMVVPLHHLVLSVCPLFSLLPFLFGHTDTPPLTCPLPECVLCFTWWVCPSLPPISCMNLLCSHLHWAVLWLHVSTASSPPTGLLLETLQKRQKGFWVSLFLINYFDGHLGPCTMHHHLSMFIGTLLICGMRSHMDLLNSIMAVLGRLTPTGVDHICNKARLVSWLVSVHFWCMSLLAHCSSGDMMMLYTVAYVAFCRIAWRFQCEVCSGIRYNFLTVQTLQMLSWLLAQGHVLTSSLTSLQLGSYCNSLKYKNGCYY